MAKIIKNYSLNFSIPKRSKKKIKFIILHYTGMKNESSAIKRLCDESSKVSSHYFIKNNGEMLNLVPDSYSAWHAGESHWKSFKSLNKYSIGNNERWKTPLGARLSRDDIVEKLKAILG